MVAAQHIEGLRLPADHYSGAAPGDCVENRFGGHFRRMDRHVLVEELRKALSALAFGDGGIAGDGGLDSAGVHARHLDRVLGDQHLLT
jgi:hypothetical protein